MEMNLNFKTIKDVVDAAKADVQNLVTQLEADQKNVELAKQKVADTEHRIKRAQAVYAHFAEFYNLDVERKNKAINEAQGFRQEVR